MWTELELTIMVMRNAVAGLCNAVRRARERGHVENERFVAQFFALIPVDKE